MPQLQYAAAALLPVRRCRLGMAQAGNPQGLVACDLLLVLELERRYAPSPACSPPTASALRRCRSAAEHLAAALGRRHSRPGHQYRCRECRHRRAWPAGMRAVDLRPLSAQPAGLLDDRQVLPFSTGVIIEPLADRAPRSPVCPPPPPTSARTTGPRRRTAIMTTDTVAQGGVAKSQSSAARPSPSPASAKGAGMIRPNMATMLGFIATDAA
jgi:hypothetical protein